MSTAKRMLLEKMEQDDVACRWCGRADAPEHECIRCGDVFHACDGEDPDGCYPSNSLCDYCEHMTSKDD